MEQLPLISSLAVNTKFINRVSTVPYLTLVQKVKSKLAKLMQSTDSNTSITSKNQVFKDRQSKAQVETLS